MKITTNEFELFYWNKNTLIIGIDEAGRGPIAGPLVVAGVVFEVGYQNSSIYDSKGLSQKKRELLFEQIISDAKEYFIKVMDADYIDTHNIYQATKLTMIDIAKSSMASVVLSDAMPFQIDNKEVIDIIKGDQKSISIAAASILAKVTRDRLMLEYDLLYPEYGFKNHKGYPTKMHIEALNKYGVLDIHRKSYGPVAKKMQMSLDLD